MLTDCCKRKTCTAYTTPQVRALWVPKLSSPPVKRDICVLRRGGDLEHRLHTDYGIRYRIDINRTLPVLSAARAAGNRTVLITETKQPRKLMRVYKPDVLSNKERLEVVMRRLAMCKCVFHADGSRYVL